jgi:transcription antitermination factor NusG
VFLSWTNEQETSNRGVGDVFILPTVNPNRYVPTQYFSYWLDAPVDVTGRVRSVATVELKNKDAEWPDAQASPLRCDRTRPIAQNPFWNLSVLWLDAQTSPIGDDRTRPVNEVPLWKGTGRTIDASDQFPSRVRSRHLPSLTLVNMIYTYGPWKDHVRSIVLSLRWLPVLTGRVRSRQRPRPIKKKRLKRLRIATQPEPSFFQLNFRLHLSYLVLSLTSVHHT